MASVNVNFRLDEEVKSKMEEVCSELGLSISEAFTLFAKKVAEERRIPFDLNIDSFYSCCNIQHLEKIVRDIKDGKAKFEEHEIEECK
ncbi:MAG: type II toxin-antitoxin system RelB/DinJ family antitoxin [Synergistes sp.]|nr:type II toxin-antitoxin system RelB/DinJ family antitoxin [Synergistes sp.]